MQSELVEVREALVRYSIVSCFHVRLTSALVGYQTPLHSVTMCHCFPYLPQESDSDNPGGGEEDSTRNTCGYSIHSAKNAQYSVFPPIGLSTIEKCWWVRSRGQQVVKSYVSMSLDAIGQDEKPSTHPPNFTVAIIHHIP